MTHHTPKIMHNIELRSAAEKACALIHRECTRLGFKLQRRPQMDNGVWSSRVDPFDQSEAAVVNWDEADGQDGALLIHQDGQIFGEYFVLRRHPQKTQLLVEAIEVWGGLDGLKTDVRLVPF